MCNYTYLVPGSIVYLSSYRLSLGLCGEQGLGFVQTEAEDLTVQFIVLLSQLLVLLKYMKRVGSRRVRGGMRIR